MTLILAATVGVAFGSGIWLLLGRDLIRTVAGLMLISNGSNLLLMSAGLSRGAAPIHPIPEGASVADPVVQALVLTAVVIGMGTVVLLLALLHRLRATAQTTDAAEVARPERQRARREVAG